MVVWLVGWSYKPRACKVRWPSSQANLSHDITLGETKRWRPYKSSPNVSDKHLPSSHGRTLRPANRYSWNPRNYRSRSLAWGRRGECLGCPGEGQSLKTEGNTCASVYVDRHMHKEKTPSRFKHQLLTTTPFRIQTPIAYNYALQWSNTCYSQPCSSKSNRQLLTATSYLQLHPIRFKRPLLTTMPFKIQIPNEQLTPWGFKHQLLTTTVCLSNFKRQLLTTTPFIIQTLRMVRTPFDIQSLTNFKDTPSRFKRQVKTMTKKN